MSGDADVLSGLCLYYGVRLCFAIAHAILRMVDHQRSRERLMAAAHIERESQDGYALRSLPQ